MKSNQPSETDNEKNPADLPSKPATGAAETPAMDPLTPEELEQFLARARAQGRLLTPEEQTLVFGERPVAPPATLPQPSVAEMAPARLDRAQVAQLAQNFFPELPLPAANLAPPLLRGVILDFDHTLAYLARPLDDLMAEGAQAADAYMRSAGMDLPPDFWPNIVEARRFSEEKSEEEQEEHLADDALSFLLQFFGYPASKMDPAVLSNAVDIFYAPEMTAWRLHTGAREMLQTLHTQSLKLAVIAHHNCDRVFQRSIDFLGLRPYLDLCICSASVEYRKPDVRLFTIALERWDALPYEVVVVGDSLRHDIQGGIELGALTVQAALGELPPQVAHDNAQLVGQIKPDALIDDLSKLPALVQGWRQ